MFKFVRFVKKEAQERAEFGFSRVELKLIFFMKKIYLLNIISQFPFNERSREAHLNR